MNKVPEQVKQICLLWKEKTKNQPFLDRKPNARQDERQTRKRKKKQVCMCGTSQRLHTLPWGKKTKEVSFIKNTE